MNAPGSARDVDPALDQCWVGLAVGIADDPVLEVQFCDVGGVQIAVAVVMTVKPDLRVFGWVVVGEIAPLTAEIQPRAG